MRLVFPDTNNGSTLSVVVVEVSVVVELVVVDTVSIAQEACNTLIQVEQHCVLIIARKKRSL